MSDFLNIATIVLCGMVQSSLQLSHGALLLLHQASLGHHRRLKTRHLTRSFIFGSAAISFLFLSTACFIVSRLPNQELNPIILSVLVGLLLGSAIVMWGLYYKRGSNTQLWLPRRFTRFMQKRAKSCNDEVESFSLGLMSAFAETPISLALFAVSANSILKLPAKYQIACIIGYLLISSLPQIVMRFRIRTGKNVAEVQRWRIKNKTFLRIISGSAYAILAIFIYAFWIA